MGIPLYLVSDLEIILTVDVVKLNAEMAQSMARSAVHVNGDVVSSGK